jgi:hypothetical protein
LKEKIIAYVKDEGSNLNALITTLKSIAYYEATGMEEKKFKALVLGMHFSKVDHMLQWMKKLCKGFKYVSIKSM